MKSAGYVERVFILNTQSNICVYNAVEQGEVQVSHRTVFLLSFSFYKKNKNTETIS